VKIKILIATVGLRVRRIKKMKGIKIMRIMRKITMALVE